MIEDIKRFLAEDIGNGDITAELFVPDACGSASIICEEEATLAGLEEAREVFEYLGAQCQLINRDGDRVVKGTTIMSVYGPLKTIITGERTALNLLMRMTGIATATANATTLIRISDPDMMVAATRKTTPGFRYYEKKAVVLGGGWSHRMGLYDMVMIKDNHLISCGGIENAMKRIKEVGEDIKIDVEVTTLEQGLIAARYRPDIIMGDHMDPEQLKKLREEVKKISPETKIEASGNITPDGARFYAGCADIVSIGALTHSAKAVHFSLDLDKD